MANSDVRKYDAPRAVRLSDAKTGSFKCVNGRSGNADQCQSGFVVGVPICENGLNVERP